MSVPRLSFFNRKRRRARPSDSDRLLIGFVDLPFTDRRLLDDFTDGEMFDQRCVLTILFAGGVAESRFLRRPRARLPLSGGERDWNLAVMSDDSKDANEAEAYVRWLLCRTRNTLTLYRDMVDIVAKDLLLKSDLISWSDLQNVGIRRAVIGIALSEAIAARFIQFLRLPGEQCA